MRILTDAELDDLRSRGTQRSFRRGTTLFSEGHRADRVMLILDGRVKISQFSQDGTETVLAIRGSGDLLGEVSAVDGQPCSATATALESVRAYVVSASDFRDLLESHPGAALRLLELVCQRLRDADRKRAEFGAFDTVGRVASRLLELRDRFGEPGEAGVEIVLPLTQEEIAGWVGASREAVAKALKSLRQAGLVETGRRRVVILDEKRLGRRAT